MGQFGVMIGQLVGFLIMLMVGYGCVRLRFYGQTALDGMCSLLLNVLIPVLVFSNAVDGADRAQLAANWGVMLLTWCSGWSPNCCGSKVRVAMYFRRRLFSATPDSSAFR